MVFFRAVKLPKRRFLVGLLLPSGSRWCPKKEIYGNPHFPEVSAFSKIREALRRLLSASVKSRMSSA